MDKSVAMEQRPKSTLRFRESIMLSKTHKHNTQITRNQSFKQKKLSYVFKKSLRKNNSYIGANYYQKETSFLSVLLC